MTTNIDQPTVQLCRHAPVDVRAVDDIVARIGRRAEHVIPILQEIQACYRYLPDTALERVCELTDITPASIVGVSSFYNHFRHDPVGEHMVSVCKGTACHVKGADLIKEAIDHHRHIAPGHDTDPEGQFTVQEIACLGCCTLGPVVQIDNHTFGHISAQNVSKMFVDFERAKSEITEQVVHRPLHRVGHGEVPELHIGLGSCCLAQGAAYVHQAFIDTLRDCGAAGAVKQVGCTGLCHQAPLVELKMPGQEPIWYTRLKPEDTVEIVNRHFRGNRIFRSARSMFSDLLEKFYSDADDGTIPLQHIPAHDSIICNFVGPQKHIATQHCKVLAPLDFDDYLYHKGFQGLKRCIAEYSPEQVIEEIKSSGLRGRGGGGFPTHVKWKIVHDQETDKKYIICNGDEGDPGAFMDRVLLESVPFRVIEGMAIAAYATGADEALFYIRAEYPLAVARVRAAIDICRDRGMLGANVLGEGKGLEMRVQEGAGAYICGEETAMIHSLEGGRGTPRVRPPFPAESGLWGKPTLINNVETLAMVPWIIRNGANAFSSLGTATSKGTKVFALAGKAVRGGLIEVPMGVTIREIVEEIGGGCLDGRTFKAVQIGGPSGGCIPAELSETPIDYESLRDIGAIMGSGGLVVLDNTDCMVDIARYFLHFTQAESCGKCTYCRVGTKRMLDILDRICEGKGKPADLDSLESLSQMVSSTSICGLGKTAPNPVLSTLRYFRHEYEAHLRGECPAGKCTGLISYQINDNCIGCTLCSQHCPVDAIPMTPYRRHLIHQDLCTKCDTCRVVCPESAVFIATGPESDGSRSVSNGRNASAVHHH